MGESPSAFLLANELFECAPRLRHGGPCAVREFLDARAPRPRAGACDAGSAAWFLRLLDSTVELEAPCVSEWLTVQVAWYVRDARLRAIARRVHGELEAATAGALRGLFGPAFVAEVDGEAADPMRALAAAMVHGADLARLVRGGLGGVFEQLLDRLDEEGASAADDESRLRAMGRVDGRTSVTITALHAPLHPTGGGSAAYDRRHAQLLPEGDLVATVGCTIDCDGLCAEELGPGAVVSGGGVSAHVAFAAPAADGRGWSCSVYDPEGDAACPAVGAVEVESAAGRRVGATVTAASTVPQGDAEALGEFNRRLDAIEVDLAAFLRCYSALADRPCPREATALSLTRLAFGDEALRRSVAVAGARSRARARAPGGPARGATELALWRTELAVLASPASPAGCETLDDWVALLAGSDARAASERVAMVGAAGRASSALRLAAPSGGDARARGAMRTSLVRATRASREAAAERAACAETLAYVQHVRLLMSRAATAFADHTARCAAEGGAAEPPSWPLPGCPPPRGGAVGERPLDEVLGRDLADELAEACFHGALPFLCAVEPPAELVVAAANAGRWVAEALRLGAVLYRGTAARLPSDAERTRLEALVARAPVDGGRAAWPCASAVAGSLGIVHAVDAAAAVVARDREDGAAALTRRLGGLRRRVRCLAERLCAHAPALRPPSLLGHRAWPPTDRFPASAARPVAPGRLLLRSAPAVRVYRLPADAARVVTYHGTWDARWREFRRPGMPRVRPDDDYDGDTRVALGIQTAAAWERSAAPPARPPGGGGGGGGRSVVATLLVRVVELSCLEVDRGSARDPPDYARASRAVGGMPANALVVASACDEPTARLVAAGLEAAARRVPAVSEVVRRVATAAALAPPSSVLAVATDAQGRALGVCSTTGGGSASDERAVEDFAARNAPLCRARRAARARVVHAVAPTCVDPRAFAWAARVWTPASFAPDAAYEDPAARRYNQVAQDQAARLGHTLGILCVFDEHLAPAGWVPLLPGGVPPPPGAVAHRGDGYEWEARVRPTGVALVRVHGRNLLHLRWILKHARRFEGEGGGGGVPRGIRAVPSVDVLKYQAAPRVGSAEWETLRARTGDVGQLRDEIRLTDAELAACYALDPRARPFADAGGREGRRSSSSLPTGPGAPEARRAWAARLRAWGRFAALLGDVRAGRTGASRSRLEEGAVGGMRHSRFWCYERGRSEFSVVLLLAAGSVPRLRAALAFEPMWAREHGAADRPVDVALSFAAGYHRLEALMRHLPICDRRGHKGRLDVTYTSRVATPTARPASMTFDWTLRGAAHRGCTAPLLPPNAPPSRIRVLPADCAWLPLRATAPHHGCLPRIAAAMLERAASDGASLEQITARVAAAGPFMAEWVGHAWKTTAASVAAIELAYPGMALPAASRTAHRATCASREAIELIAPVPITIPTTPYTHCKIDSRPLAHALTWLEDLRDLPPVHDVDGWLVPRAAVRAEDGQGHSVDGLALYVLWYWLHGVYGSRISPRERG